ncbi:MAG: hypothetical protein ACI4MQ_02335 [Candidatus Coproplasma sp.]
MNKKQRTEQYEIGGTVYTVIAEESENARGTQSDIINSLLKRHFDEINSTNLLFATNGGKKEC